MNHFPKKKRAVYEKEFTLQHVLQNLQGYRLATGDVDPHLISNIRQAHGDDEGRVYGALITGAGKLASAQSSRKIFKTSADSHLGGKRERSGRKRARKRRKRSRNEVAPVTASTEDSEQLLPMSKLGAVAGVSHSKDVSSGSLGLLAMYRGNSSSSDNSDAETTSGRQDTLPVPSVIQDMFLEEARRPPGLAEARIHEAKASYWDSPGGDDNLGFFEADSSSEEDDNARGAAFSAAGTGHSPEILRDCARGKEPSAQSRLKGLELTSYTCWKCSHVGHLAQDCTVLIGAGGGAMVKAKIPRTLQVMYATCRELKSRKSPRCSDCGIHSNLASCLDCGCILCDGRGHLATHLLDHVSHNSLFSFKLGRLLKCCKSTCGVVSVYDLLVCSHCLGKAFSQHYSMITAIWSPAGLRKIPNALCCQEHFQWHRMNCPNVCEEPFISEQKLLSHNNSSGLLSEFYF